MKQTAKDDLNLPDIYFAFYRAILIFDKFTPGRLYASILESNDTTAKKTSDILSEIKHILSQPPKKNRAGNTAYNPEFI